MIKIKTHILVGVVAQACDPSTLEGKGKDVKDPVQANLSHITIPVR